MAEVSGQKILIVGPGYVGSELAKGLAEKRTDVWVASRSGKIVDGCETVAMDVSDRNSVQSAGEKIDNPDAIIHCASSSRGAEDSYRKVYLDGTANLVEAFPHTSLIFTSSTSVYPQTDGSIVTEDSPANPDSENGRILREAEDTVLAAGGSVLRLSGIYGPGRSIHLKRIFSGEAQIESGEPGRLLNQIHRDDIVSAIVHLLSLAPEDFRGEIFNLSDDTSLTMRTCYEWLAERYQKKLGPEVEANRTGKRAWTNKQVDNSKLRKTGWAPRYPSFKDAVKNDERLVRSIVDAPAP